MGCKDSVVDVVALSFQQLSSSVDNGKLCLRYIRDILYNHRTRAASLTATS